MIDADSKMILSHAVGKRDESTCDRFLTRLKKATIGLCQINAAGLRLYTYNVPFHMVQHGANRTWRWAAR